jgi:hypothetical protein
MVKERSYEPLFNGQCLFPRFKPLQNLDFTVVEVPDPLMSYGRPKVGFPVIPMDPVVEPRESWESNAISVKPKSQVGNFRSLLQKQHI